MPERNNDHSKLLFFDCLTNNTYKYLIYITTLFAFALNILANWKEGANKQKTFMTCSVLMIKSNE